MSARRPRVGGLRFYYGWVIVVVIALTSFTTSAETFNVLGVFLKPLTLEFGWSRSSFAAATSTGSLLGGVIALGVGPLIDRFGARVALVISLSLLGGVFLLMVWMTSLWQFYALQTLGRALNNGVLGVAASIVIPKWFIAKRGRAVAFSGLGSGIGEHDHTCIRPTLGERPRLAYGRRHGGSDSLGGIVAACGLPSSPPARGHGVAARRRPLSDSARRTGGAGQQGAPPPVETSYKFREASQLSSFYFLVINVCATWFIRTGITLNFIAYLTDQGLSPTIAVTTLAVNGATAAAASVVWGFLAERYSVRLGLTVGSLMVGAGLLVLLGVRTELVALVWGAYWGVANASSLTLQRVIFADYFGRRYLGSIQGVVRSVQTVAQAAGPLAATLAYDFLGSYKPVFILMAAIAGIGAACVFVAQPPKEPRETVAGQLEA